MSLPLAGGPSVSAQRETRANKLGVLWSLRVSHTWPGRRSLWRVQAQKSTKWYVIPVKSRSRSFIARYVASSRLLLRLPIPRRPMEVGHFSQEIDCCRHREAIK